MRSFDLARLLHPALLTSLLLPTLVGCDFFIPLPVGFDVRESVEQLHVTRAEPGEKILVFDGRWRRVTKGEADDQGSLMVRELDPDRNYWLIVGRGFFRGVSGPHEVLSVEESLPERSFYENQVLVPGFNYITTRDGTTLSAYVQLPGPPEDGPYPTLVNYSGYEPSKPGAPLDLPPELQDLAQVLCAGPLPVLCDAPNHPSGLIGGVFGFATVGVNIRGTGCSGGAYDYFETLQVLDGYDMIEVIASQDWVLGNKVGMAGLSYPGISQLFVAQSRPPGLASITPLSVIAESTSSILAPGGIFNDGFAFEWTERVIENARPFGQGWEEEQAAREAEEGVTTCADNQLLHAQARDVIQLALDNPFYTPELADPVNPTTFVGQIDVPVFVSGAWQDEQTGPHFATLLDDFVNAPVRRFTVFNGLHADGYVPQVLAEWLAFNSIYVAEAIPSIDPVLAAFSGLLFENVLGVPLSLPEIPFSDAATFEEARAAYEAQPELRAIFENGVADVLFPTGPEDEGFLGAPQGTFDVWFDAWPPPETEPYRLYLNADGGLRETTPVEEESSSAFAHDDEAGQRTLGGGQPFYEWAPTPPGSAAVFVTDPFAEDTVMLGSASADLYVQSSEPDADLEVLISEVRPDGKETYVQAGWLRVSQRKLADDATELRPVKTHLEADVQPLPKQGFALARIEVMPFGHIFRAGSRLRIQIDTPGDSRERWRFMLQEYDSADVTHYVAHSFEYPSSLVLPVIPDVEVPTDQPPCPGLRGQPCRDYEPYWNTLEDPQPRADHEDEEPPADDDFRSWFEWWWKKIFGGAGYV